jgi:hypothetical protein
VKEPAADVRDTRPGGVARLLYLCRLGLGGRVPDHSTFSKTRHGRFRDSDAFRRLFEMVVQRAMTEGLVGGEGFAVDASLIAADANKQRCFASTDEVDWRELAVARRSVREYLDTLDAAAWGAASEVCRSSSRARTRRRSGRAPIKATPSSPMWITI